MSQALVFLAQREYANAISRRVRRLREPRYLLALGAAVAYLVFLLPRRSGDPMAMPSTGGLPVEPLLMLAAGALLLWGWLFADRRTPLEFTPAELTWLFPAPIPRRTLILYKLGRWQLPLLFNSLLLTLLFSADRSIGLSIRRVLAVWVLLGALRLHRLAASLVRSRWFEPGSAGTARSPAVVPALAWVLVLVWAAINVTGARGIGDAIQQFAMQPAARVALLPIALVVHPVFATPSVGGWLLAMLPAMALLAVHVVWVVRADAVFAKVAVAAAGRGETTEIDLREQARVRPSVAPVLVPLLATGAPMGALLWKQLVPLLRRDRVLRGVAGFAAAFAACLLIRAVPTGELASLVVATLTVLVGALMVAGPQLIRLDLRRELPRWELLRSLPLPGSSVLLGLSAATFVAVTTLQGLGLLLLLALDAGTVAGWPDGTLPWLSRAVLVLPPLNALGSLTALAGAVLFPAWSAPIIRRGGLDALGTNLLALAGYLVALVVLASPPLLAAIVSSGEDGLLNAGSTSLTLAAIAAWAVTAVEATLLLHWLGRRFDRTDRAATGLS